MAATGSHGLSYYLLRKKLPMKASQVQSKGVSIHTYGL